MKYRLKQAEIIPIKDLTADELTKGRFEACEKLICKDDEKMIDLIGMSILAVGDELTVAFACKKLVKEIDADKKVVESIKNDKGRFPLKEFNAVVKNRDDRLGDDIELVDDDKPSQADSAKRGRKVAQ